VVLEFAEIVPCFNRQGMKEALFHGLARRAEHDKNVKNSKVFRTGDHQFFPDFDFVLSKNCQPRKKDKEKKEEDNQDDQHLLAQYILLSLSLNCEAFFLPLFYRFFFIEY
jgi:hypothetical protein